MNPTNPRHQFELISKVISGTKLSSKEKEKIEHQLKSDPCSKINNRKESNLVFNSNNKEVVCVKDNRFDCFRILGWSEKGKKEFVINPQIEKDLKKNIKATKK